MTSMKLTPAQATSTAIWPAPGSGTGSSATRVALASGAGLSKTSARITAASQPRRPGIDQPFRRSLKRSGGGQAPGVGEPDVTPVRRARRKKKPRYAGLSPCAEEDSNLHPVIPDQALNLARLPIPPSARAARPSIALAG